MPWGNNFFPLLIVTSGGGFTGLFVYSPGPGPGNLIFSVAAQNGTDPYGNPYVAIATAYNTVPGRFVGLTQGGIQFSSNRTAPATTITAAGLMSLGDSTAAGVAPRIDFNAPSTSGGSPIGDISLLGTSQDGTALGQVIIAGAVGPASLTSGVLEVHGTTVATGGVWAQAGVASGAAPTGAEPWNSLGSLGAHYTVTLGRYRMRAENEVELDILVSGDGAQATSTTFATTLPAAYRPATSHNNLPMGTNHAVTTGDIWPRLDVTSAGAVTVTNQGTANAFAFCGRIPLD